MAVAAARQCCELLVDDKISSRLRREASESLMVMMITVLSSYAASYQLFTIGQADQNLIFRR